MSALQARPELIPVLRPGGDACLLRCRKGPSWIAGHLSTRRGRTLRTIMCGQTPTEPYDHESQAREAKNAVPNRPPQRARQSPVASSACAA
jgi:hypothetical protein